MDYHTGTSETGDQEISILPPLVVQPSKGLLRIEVFAIVDVGEIPIDNVSPF